jgi:hypothetical protein
MENLLEPLALMDRSLRAGGMADIAHVGLDRSLTQARIFGLHAARLDLRQYSEYNSRRPRRTARSPRLVRRFRRTRRPRPRCCPERRLARPAPDLTQLDNLSARHVKRSTCSASSTGRGLLRLGAFRPTSSA